METAQADKPTKSAFAAMVAGVLVIIAGFIMYNYFSKSGGEITQESGQTTLQQESTQNQAQPEAKQENVAGAETTTPASTIDNTAEVWAANDYKAGDITGNTYTVVRGDTLWEIAQARYGDPYMWTKIRDANTDKVGQLSNGNPLITPGQVLILPD